jgi:hypothetical protein
MSIKRMSAPVIPQKKGVMKFVDFAILALLVLWFKSILRNAEPEPI